MFKPKGTIVLSIFTLRKDLLGCPREYPYDMNVGMSCRITSPSKKTMRQHWGEYTATLYENFTKSRDYGKRYCKEFSFPVDQFSPH